MKNYSLGILCFAGLLLATVSARAQDPGAPAGGPTNTNQKKVDDPSEISKFKETCGSFEIKEAGGCAELPRIEHRVPMVFE